MEEKQTEVDKYKKELTDSDYESKIADDKAKLANAEAEANKYSSAKQEALDDGDKNS